MGESLPADFSSRRYDLEAMGMRLREELTRPELCDLVLDDLAFAAGRLMRDHRDLVQWAEREGDEATLVELHKMSSVLYAAVNEGIGALRRWKARLEAEATHQGGPS